MNACWPFGPLLFSLSLPLPSWFLLPAHPTLFAEFTSAAALHRLGQIQEWAPNMVLVELSWFSWLLCVSVLIRTRQLDDQQKKTLLDSRLKQDRKLHKNMHEWESQSETVYSPDASRQTRLNQSDQNNMLEKSKNIIQLKTGDKLNQRRFDVSILPHTITTSAISEV